MNRNETHSMRLGIGSYTYPWAVGIPGHRPARPLTATDLLDKAAQLGVSVVQICDNLPLEALSEPQLEELRRAARQREIAVEVGTRGIFPNHLRRQLDLARYFASPILRVVIDTPAHHPSLDEVVHLLSPWRSELERADICLAIENHDRFTAGQFRDMVTRLDSPHIGICLDTVNSFGALGGSGDHRCRIGAVGRESACQRILDSTRGPPVGLRDRRLSRRSRPVGCALAAAGVAPGRADSQPHPGTVARTGVVARGYNRERGAMGGGERDVSAYTDRKLTTEIEKGIEP